MKKTFIDPVTLAKLSNMMLRARFVVEGFVTGLHQSPFRGFSLEFAHHRKYAPGDELRHLDWKVYGRTDRYYVKQFQEETNLKSYILLDSSASMGYGSRGITKLQYSSYLAAALSYLMLRQQDSVGMVTFNDGIREYIPPRSSTNHLSVIMDALESLTPISGTGLKRVMADLGKYIKRRGLIIIISDFFDNDFQVIESLKYYRFRKHEVIVFHVLDPAELELPFKESVNFRDMETSEELLTQPELIRKTYREHLDRFIENYKYRCREADVDYWQIDTSVPLDYSLGAYLARRHLVE